MTDHVKVYGVKPRIQYTANGTSTSFDFSFAIFKTSDVNVYFGDTLQNSSSYTVSGSNNSEGGTVTFNTAPAAGTVITIIRNLSIERTTDFQEGGTLRAEVLNDELDYQIACQQQIAENLNRSMVLPPYATDNDLDLTLPTPSAGKAIVWNSTGTNLENSTVSVNALESTLNSYKTQAQTAATTATNQASAAATQAQTATTQAGIATTKATEANAALNQLNNMRCNCITNIPQDLKLTLSSGTVTLKSGSKIYVPNGSGIFSEITIENDVTRAFTLSNVTVMLFLVQDSLALVAQQLSFCTSGTSAPSGNGTFYNTSNNTIRSYTSGTASTQKISLPLAIISADSSGNLSIDRVFNGFGYIGSTAFALPGVKGLIPNGRNSDGTLKNTVFTTSNVLTSSDTSSSDNVRLISENSLSRISVTNYYYNPETNYIINKSNNSIEARCVFATDTTTSGVISNWKAKQAFHATNYLDAVKYTDKQDVVKWGMPDGSKASSISTSTTSYTATSNGYITFTAKGNNSSAKAYVDNKLVFESNSPYAASNTFPIGKGSTFTRSGGSEIMSITFVPCKGG